MARKRMIDPEIFDSAESKGWTTSDFVVMVAAISAADDEGRGRVTHIKKNVISMMTEKKFQKSLRKLSDSIVIYQKIYFFLPKFKKYQWLTKPRPSKFPEPNLLEDKDLTENNSDNIPNSFRENSDLIERNRIERNRERIEPPTLAVVIKFFLEQKHTEKDANKFYNYYAARNWRIDGEDIIDWEAAAKGWMLRESEFTKPKNNKDKDQNIESNSSKKSKEWKESIKEAEEKIKKEGKFKGFKEIENVESDSNNEENQDLPI